jgi:chromate transporter
MRPDGRDVDLRLMEGSLKIEAGTAAAPRLCGFARVPAMDVVVGFARTDGTGPTIGAFREADSALDSSGSGPGATPAVTPPTPGLEGVTRGALFASFLKMGLLGFGGVLPWARRVIVDERRWLDDRAFAELLGFCQVLPGPNVVNLAVIVGARTHGPQGALIGVTGILLVPVGLLLLIATFYASVASDVLVQNAIAGASAAAAGLIIGTALRLLIHARPPVRGLLVGAAAFLTVGVLQWPLLWVIAVLVPVALVAEWQATRVRR